ncbi:hypothetical protein G6011_08260, partial [Alternaria panax]
MTLRNKTISTVVKVDSSLNKTSVGTANSTTIDVDETSVTPG